MKLASHDKRVAPDTSTFAESRGARVVSLFWGGMKDIKLR